MTEADLVDALETLVSNRVFPDIAPSLTPRPYITYQQVGGKAVNFLGAETADKKNARIQITVWSDTRLEANTLIRSVEDLMVADPLCGFVEGAAIAAYDEPTKLRGAHQDFSFWITS